MLSKNPKSTNFSKSRKPTSPQKNEPDESLEFGFVDPYLRRILADLTFERCLLEYQRSQLSSSTQSFPSDETFNDLWNSAEPIQSEILKLSIARNGLEKLITSTHTATLLDNDHLPSHAYLGQLYYENGQYDLAEHWLERACKSIKARGSGGGTSSYYGGPTSFWGWNSWAYLGRVLLKTGRTEQGRQCLVFSTGIECVSPIRGFDSLNRLLFRE